MDIQTNLNASIQAKIRKDYNALSMCVEYMSTVVLCWGRQHSEQQKKTLKHFLSLRKKGEVPSYVSVEAVKAWIIRQARNSFRMRFQRENAAEDDLINMTWEVNMRLKLQDIEREACRELGQTVSSLNPLTGDDPRLAALSDPRSSAVAEVSDPGIFARYQFDPDFVVRRAVREIVGDLLHLPAPRPPCLSEVVVDMVTGLLQAIKCDQEDRSGVPASSRQLSVVAVGTVMGVLQEVSAPLTSEVQPQYCPSTRAEVVAELHRELLGKAGSSEALKRALRMNDTGLRSIVTATVTTAVKKLCEPLDAVELASNVLEPTTAMVDVPEPALDDADAALHVPEPGLDVQDVVLDVPKSVLDVAQPDPNILEPAKPTMDVLEPAVDVPDTHLDIPEPAVDVADPVLNVSEPVKPTVGVLEPAADVPEPAKPIMDEPGLDVQDPILGVQDSALGEVKPVLSSEERFQYCVDTFWYIQNNIRDIQNTPKRSMDARKLMLSLPEPSSDTESVQDFEPAPDNRDSKSAWNRLVKDSLPYCPVPRGTQTGHIVDGPYALPSDRTDGGKEQSKKAKKPKKGIRRLLSYMWKAVRRNILCCCSCVSAETD